MSDIITEPYNVVLSLPCHITNSNQTILLSNESLHERFRRVKSRVTYSDMNKIVVQAVDDCTVGDRFGRDSMGKRLVNMTPYPQLHFFSFAMAEQEPTIGKLELKRMLFDLTNKDKSLSGIGNGMHLGMNPILRGVESGPYYPTQIELFKQKQTKRYSRTKLRCADWLDVVNTTETKHLRPGECSATLSLLSNTSGIRQPIDTIAQSCQKMLTKRAFVHHYQSEGLELDELNEALSHTFDLLSNYGEVEPNDCDCGEEEGDCDGDSYC